MARRKQTQLKIVFTYKASVAVRGIWRWNAENGGDKQADKNEALLFRHIRSLSRFPELGESIPEFEGVRRLLIMQRSGGYGHIAIYRIFENSVQILLIFHSARDWETNLNKEINP